MHSTKLDTQTITDHRDEGTRDFRDIYFEDTSDLSSNISPVSESLYNIYVLFMETQLSWTEEPPILFLI